MLSQSVPLQKLITNDIRVLLIQFHSNRFEWEFLLRRMYESLDVSLLYANIDCWIETFVSSERTVLRPLETLFWWHTVIILLWSRFLSQAENISGWWNGSQSIDWLDGWLFVDSKMHPSFYKWLKEALIIYSKKEITLEHKIFFHQNSIYFRPLSQGNGIR